MGITLADCRIEGSADARILGGTTSETLSAWAESQVQISKSSRKHVVYRDIMMTVVVWIEITASLTLTCQLGAGIMRMHGQAVVALKARIYLSPQLRPPGALELHLHSNLQARTLSAFHC